MTMDRIRLGVIGMGVSNMASTLVLLADEPDLRYEITAICSGSQATVDTVCDRYNIPFGCTDYRELVARDDVDVVAVFSPDHLHAEHCRAALGSGKHVVCTKPMVTSLEDAQDLANLAREKQRKFLVGQTMRFDRQFQMAKKHFDDGDLGRLIAIESHYLHDMRPVYDATPWRLDVPQDFMYGGCVHSLDVIRAFAGDIQSVHAIANKGQMTDGYPIEDNFFINVQFTSGVIGRVSGLYGIVHPPIPMMQFRVFGDKGSLQADFTDNEPGEVRVVLDSDPKHRAVITAFEPERDLSAYGHGATVIRYMRHFQDCLDNDVDPIPSVLDGANAVAAGAAAWESIKTGRVVDVPAVSTPQGTGS
jgi:predicted dehydrogenase